MLTNSDFEKNVNHLISTASDLADVRARARMRRWMLSEAIRVGWDIEQQHGTPARRIADDAMGRLITMCCRELQPNLHTEAQGED